MERLRNYLTESGRGAAVRLAASIGVRPVIISQWATGKKAVPPRRAVMLEVATAGRVRRWDCRPVDWHDIWPELVGADGAPRAVIGKAA